ncbi:hypothetical protein C8J32_10443 [Rhizobium sp. PP-CC-3A-592]|nr:hypothetical protein C8J32_10443 [Rhizobium sp. PP-CC-3A-592]
MGKRTYNIDIELLLADGAAAVTADGVSQVASANVSKELGPGRFEGVLIVDVSAVKTTAGDEVYNLLLQGSADNTFATKETVAQYTLGAGAARPGAPITSPIGRYEIPFTTEQHDNEYRWLRLYTDVVGTAPSITLKAFIAERY